MTALATTVGSARILRQWARNAVWLLGVMAAIPAAPASS